MMTSSIPEPYMEEVTREDRPKKEDQIYERSASNQLVLEGTSITEESSNAGVHIPGDSNLGEDEQSRAWKQELEKTEEEIHTLRQVLTSKMRQAHDLRKQLGIGGVKDDLRHSIQTIREFEAVQKTTAAVKAAKDMTSSSLESAGSRLSAKLGNIRDYVAQMKENSTTFRSFEEKVGSAYTTVKTRIAYSKSTDEMDPVITEMPTNDTADVTNGANI